MEEPVHNETAESEQPNGQAMYYSITPHIDDDDLDPFEMRVLIRIRRRAGTNGVCNEAVPNMAKGTKMTAVKVRESLTALVRKHRIRIRKVKGRPNQVFPIDIMQRNLDRYTPDENDRGAYRKRQGPLTNSSRAPTENVRGPSRIRHGRLPKTSHEEVTIKKEPIRKNQQEGAAADGGGDVWGFLTGIGVNRNRRTVPGARGASLWQMEALWGQFKHKGPAGIRMMAEAVSNRDWETVKKKTAEKSGNIFAALDARKQTQDQSSMEDRRRQKIIDDDNQRKAMAAKANGQAA